MNNNTVMGRIRHDLLPGRVLAMYRPQAAPTRTTALSDRRRQALYRKGARAFTARMGQRDTPEELHGPQARQLAHVGSGQKRPPTPPPQALKNAIRASRRRDIGAIYRWSWYSQTRHGDPRMRQSERADAMRLPRDEQRRRGRAETTYGHRGRKQNQPGPQYAAARTRASTATPWSWGRARSLASSENTAMATRSHLRRCSRSLELTCTCQTRA